MWRALLVVVVLIWAASAARAQQAVRVPVEVGGRTLQLSATLYRPAAAAKTAKYIHT